MNRFQHGHRAQTPDLGHGPLGGATLGFGQFPGSFADLPPLFGIAQDSFSFKSRKARWRGNGMLLCGTLTAARRRFLKDSR